MGVMFGSGGGFIGGVFQIIQGNILVGGALCLLGAAGFAFGLVIAGD